MLFFLYGASPRERSLNKPGTRFDLPSCTVSTGLSTVSHNVSNSSRARIREPQPLPSISGIMNPCKPGRTPFHRLRQQKLDCLFAINGYVALPLLADRDLRFHAFSDSDNVVPKSASSHISRWRPEPKCIGWAISVLTPSSRQQRHHESRRELDPKSRSYRHVRLSYLADEPSKFLKSYDVSWFRDKEILIGQIGPAKNRI